MIIDPEPGRPRENSLLASMATDSRFRRLVSILREAPTGLSEDELVSRLAARKRDAPSSGAPGSERDRIAADLHHRFLPRLEAAGWVERRPAGIVATDRCPGRGTIASVPHLEDLDRTTRKALAALLESPWRRHVASILADAGRTVALDELADEVVAGEEPARAPVGEDPGDDVLVVLHHRLLPMLDAAGLVDYDADEGTVAPEPPLPRALERTEPDFEEQP